MKNLVEELKGTVETNTRHIEALNEKLNKMKLCETSFRCESWDYEASFTTVLKSHMTRKHKHFKLELCSFESSSSTGMESHVDMMHKTEVLRTESYIDQRDSLNLTPPSQLREKDTPSSPHRG